MKSYKWTDKWKFIITWNPGVFRTASVLLIPLWSRSWILWCWCPACSCWLDDGCRRISAWFTVVELLLLSICLAVSCCVGSDALFILCVTPVGRLLRQQRTCYGQQSQFENVLIFEACLGHRLLCPSNDMFWNSGAKNVDVYKRQGWYSTNVRQFREFTLYNFNKNNLSFSAVVKNTLCLYKSTI